MNQQRTLFFDMHAKPATLQRAATRIDGRALGLMVGLLLLLACAGLLYLSQASTEAELRYALRAHQVEAQELYEQIILLRCQVAGGRSITSLEKRARQLGLVDAQPSDPQVVCDVPVVAATGIDLTGFGRAGLERPAAPAAAIARPNPLEWLRLHLLPGARAAQLE